VLLRQPLRLEQRTRATLVCDVGDERQEAPHPTVANDRSAGERHVAQPVLGVTHELWNGVQAGEALDVSHAPRAGHEIDPLAERGQRGRVHGQELAPGRGGHVAHAEDRGCPSRVLPVDRQVGIEGEDTLVQVVEHDAHFRRLLAEPVQRVLDLPAHMLERFGEPAHLPVARRGERCVQIAQGDLVGRLRQIRQGRGDRSGRDRGEQDTDDEDGDADEQAVPALRRDRHMLGIEAHDELDLAQNLALVDDGLDDAQDLVLDRRGQGVRAVLADHVPVCVAGDHDAQIGVRARELEGR
jgi:hypothetical protein